MIAHSFQRIWSLFKARNKEFMRDRATLGWNFAFPVLIVIGFGFLFTEDRGLTFKIGHFNGSRASLPETFRDLKHLEFVEFKDEKKAMDRLMHHKVDLLVKAGTSPVEYWMSETSPKSFSAEKFLLSSLSTQPQVVKKAVQGQEVRYIDWLFPGILGMNLMFSALFGVGYVVVRYRKNGVLKRFKVTPLSAFEFLVAQISSRLFLLMFTTAIVFFGCKAFMGFEVRGSYLDLFLIFFLGSCSLVSVGLLIASRSSSEEFAGGVLNLISWPMMFLSEVWFSIEGSNPVMIAAANALPLTHTITGARKIMNDGAGLSELGFEVGFMAIFSLVMLAMGAALFRWNKA